ncbi:hypothetical protein ZOSMA_477G00100 [Zostera marina]|uniref:Uncharacterized protein n=1 Tax=Zostera marina TaxID=29655 RepID=A0A0K9NZQ9_ZOSMR|nr:hypothetical protein ZOSMA_477G00100 [Zostera marina]
MQGGSGIEIIDGKTKTFTNVERKVKPEFRLVEDDTKPLLRDPIIRSDPMETEQAVLRLPHFPKTQIK